jgi:hypothetical protein
MNSWRLCLRVKKFHAKARSSQRRAPAWSSLRSGTSSQSCVNGNFLFFACFAPLRDNHRVPEVLCFPVITHFLICCSPGGGYMTENQIATIIVDASLKIHRTLGP